ncbi:hypothetical protein BP6252_13979 [Coleophoma cylindrospora]|uniref:DUF1868 domain-containing protein n=1 Tax=Coleophoma cylindrospora TaxID=1849047 RepID=A0A3D8Q4K1_9HELO|nr:hypothetical protein BP6252_13979 [Coleophoma cylindrospora]
MTSTTTIPSPATLIPPSRPQYPIGIPSKFGPDGSVHRYPGNTTVCHIPSTAPIIPGLHAIYDTFSTHPTLSQRIHLLPPSSWHMTVLDGVREEECEPGMWAIGKEKQPLDECTAEFTPRLRQLGLQLEGEGLAPPYRMRIRGFGDLTVGIGLEVEGQTVEEEKRMRRLRDRLADTLGFRAPNHETYPFHISTAYMMRWIEGEDREELDRVLAKLLAEMPKEFELGAVEFNTFEDMHAFPRLFYLGEKEN